MSKHYSRDRSPLSPLRYERTAGHSRSAKSPIGISKPYSSDSYKGLSSYRGKSFDKYADKKYSKRDNGYKDVLDTKYEQWRPKDDYKADSSRKHGDYKLDRDRKRSDYKVNRDRKHDDYKGSYKKPERTEPSKYNKTSYKDDYKRPVARERSPKYEKNYYKDNVKRLSKDSFDKKPDYKYKDYPSGGSFKSNSRYKDDLYYKDSLPISYKDSHKKSHYSPEPYAGSSRKDAFSKPSERIGISDRSSYKDISLYGDKRYGDYLPSKDYPQLDFPDKYFDEFLCHSNKYGSKDYKSFKDGGENGSSRRRNDADEFSSYLFTNEYSPRNNNSYERYVIGDSVVYGSPGHPPQDVFSPGPQMPRLENYLTLTTNNTRFSLTPPRYGRADNYKKNTRQSPVRSRRPLSPLRSNKSRTSFSNNQMLPSRRTSKDNYSGDRQRNSSLKRATSLRRPKAGYDDSFGSTLSSKGRGGVSPPKPLLSIRLPASSIPRASRMHIDQTVSINDQVLPRGRRMELGRRWDGRLGRADGTRTRDRPSKPSDLRLWIESRKNVNKKAAKIFPTKSVQSRRENLSAIASRVRLLQARKRALENGTKGRGMATKRIVDGPRSKGVRNVRPARPNNPKPREPRRRSKSPVRRPLRRKVAPERRRTGATSKGATSTAVRRTTTVRRAKATRGEASKRTPSKKSRRSPLPTRRLSSSAKKDHEKR